MTRIDITPAQLAHCIRLAREFYYAHADFYGINTDDLPFGSLPLAQKTAWIDRALEIIEGVGAPGRVIAMITPNAPWWIAS